VQKKRVQSFTHRAVDSLPRVPAQSDPRFSKSFTGTGTADSLSRAPAESDPRFTACKSQSFTGSGAAPRRSTPTPGTSTERGSHSELTLTQMRPALKQPLALHQLKPSGEGEGGAQGL